MVIYDIEIEKAIRSKGEPEEEGIKYCEGWHDHAGMGIAVIGAYEYDTDRYRVFTDDNLDDFRALVERHEVVAGFNSRGFDDCVCRAAGIEIDPVKSYDLLVEMWAGAGLGSKFNPRTHGGYGLDQTCRVNFGTVKSGTGAKAPIDWQRGRIGSVIDYCLNDVWLTKQLMDLVLATGEVRNPKNPHQFLRVRRPGEDR